MRFVVLLISLIWCHAAFAEHDDVFHWLTIEMPSASGFPVDQPTSFEWRVDDMFAPEPAQLDDMRRSAQTNDATAALVRTYERQRLYDSLVAATLDSSLVLAFPIP